ncbi:MAG: DALR domain-containing protein, partial [Pirellula sp.]
MDADFNTGGATADLFEMARALNRYIDQAKLEETRKPEDLELLKQGLG